MLPSAIATGGAALGLAACFCRPGGQAPNGQALADGRWAHKSAPHLVEVIGGGEIVWYTGKKSPVKDEGGGKISVLFDGKRHVAELQPAPRKGKKRDKQTEQLVWDDGDVWVREGAVAAQAPAQPAEEAPAAEVARGAGEGQAIFQGRWVHREQQHLVESIFGDRVTWHDGQKTPFTVLGDGRLHMNFEGIDLIAQLEPSYVPGEPRDPLRDQLVWDDGDIWVREGAAPEPAPAPAPVPEPDPAPAQPPPPAAPPSPTFLPTPEPARSYTPMEPVASYSPAGSHVLPPPVAVAKVEGPLDGRWVHKKQPQLLEVISGSEVTWHNGTTTRFIEEGIGRLLMDFEGQTLRAHLEPPYAEGIPRNKLLDEILWDDGDIWIREEAAVNLPLSNPSASLLSAKVRLKLDIEGQWKWRWVALQGDMLFICHSTDGGGSVSPVSLHRLAERAICISGATVTDNGTGMLRIEGLEAPGPKSIRFLFGKDVQKQWDDALRSAVSKGGLADALDRAILRAAESPRFAGASPTSQGWGQLSPTRPKEDYTPYSESVAYAQLPAPSLNLGGLAAQTTFGVSPRSSLPSASPTRGARPSNTSFPQLAHQLNQAEAQARALTELFQQRDAMRRQALEALSPRRAAAEAAAATTAAAMAGAARGY